ncbi:hypothetical protein ACPV36_12470 [Photobacterium damselae]|uniref:hypothetical protein n=1 Tax=Photobacterium damselae TaxID=38293 RepID=UPI004067F232
MALFAKFYKIHMHNMNGNWDVIIPASNRIHAKTTIYEITTVIDKIIDLGCHRVKIDLSQCGTVFFQIVVETDIITYEPFNLGYDNLLSLFSKEIEVLISDGI